RLQIQLTLQLPTHSAPDRDPRQHTITTVYIAQAKGIPKAGDDALEVASFSKENLPSPIVFDHSQILADYFNHRF
ncbi:MAG: hypothetical protein LWW90_08365, partial [Candidatus Desulfofervidus auxilii]|nr:hypothetical protein [Candidatus Desulfofervidus auxilii]